MELSKTTLVELRDKLGFEDLSAYPIVLTVLVTALAELSIKAKREIGEALLQGLNTEASLALDDVNSLDRDATETGSWMLVKSAGRDQWECIRMFLENGVWLTAEVFEGSTPEVARGKAAYTICGPCRTGDCCNPRHGW